MSGATAYPAVTMVSRMRATMLESKTVSINSPCCFSPRVSSDQQAEVGHGGRVVWHFSAAVSRLPPVSSPTRTNDKIVTVILRGRAFSPAPPISPAQRQGSLRYLEWGENRME